MSVLSIMAGAAFEDTELKFITRHLKSDIAHSIKLVSCDQARYLVDLYYQIQGSRIATNAQMRTLAEGDEPADIMRLIGTSYENMEKIIKDALGAFAGEYRVGRWLQSICGIGPVLSAGFLSTFDIRDRKTASSWWRYAGLDPSVEWEKGKKRPFDARAKVLCFKAGECFIKVQNNDSDIYGKIYASKKADEAEKNERGEYSEQASMKLEKFKIGKTTDAYKAYSQGKLPPAHLHARARRYAVKIFLSHLHDVSWQDFYGTKTPVPYVFSDEFKGGVHRKFIPPSPIDDFEGKSLKELLDSQKVRKKKAKICD
jgi:hypothetical protein